MLLREAGEIGEYEYEEVGLRMVMRERVVSVFCHKHGNLSRGVVY